MGSSVESTGAPPLRVLVVEDSLTVRKHLVELIESEAGFEVAGEAQDGARAVQLCEELRPHVITMDMALDGLSGLAATERIMARHPTPILIISASVNRGDAFKTFDALAAGAVDVLEKPADGVASDLWRRELFSKLRLISRIKVITHVRGMIQPAHDPVAEHSASLADAGATPPRLAVIGASTGGPAAVLEILRKLPGDFPLPILLVLHLSTPFAPAFGDWLKGQARMPVEFAADGMQLPPPGRTQVLIAPPERHLVLRQGRLRLTGDPERNSCRPSIDVLFESVASELGPAAIGCLLTGMGRDGAQGLLAIRRSGGTALVQDQETSVVFGMPSEAIRLGAAERVLPLQGFAPALQALAAQAASGARP